MVGFPPGLVAFEPMELVVHQLSITSSLLGSPSAMREMLSFAQSHGIRSKVEIMPMPSVNDALQKLKENRARYRIVLVNGKMESESGTDREPPPTSDPVRGNVILIRSVSSWESPTRGKPT